MSKIFLFLLLIGLLGAGVYFGMGNKSRDNLQTIGLSTPINSKTHVSVNFAQSVNAKSMYGFLHGMDATNPSDGFIEPLKPKLIREGKEYAEVAYPRAIEFGARYMVILGDLWGWPSWGVKQPWAYNDNYATWENFVRNVAQKSKGKNIIWDIWNEPSGKEQWTGTGEQFCETFARAEKVLRSELGASIKIAGPSWAFYSSSTQFSALLDCLQSKNVKLDILAWHELQPEKDIAKISEHIKDYREKYVNNLAYRKLGITELMIPEFGGEDTQYFPGAQLALLYYMEKGGADAASHACWTINNVNVCFNNSIDGLLTNKTFFNRTQKPRAVWWATKAYSDSVARRVVSASDNAQIIPFASKSSDGGGGVLIGMYKAYPFATSASVLLEMDGFKNLPFTQSLSVVKIKLYKIPNSGEAALSAPILVAEKIVPIKDGKIILPLPTLNVEEAFIVKIGG